MNFGESILNWYYQNKRDLPWRNTGNPYRIWLSEIILQQTRVEQGLAYYKSFVKQYPTVKKLAAAKEDEVLRLWQGLGYYTRARNLHHTAKEIVKKYKGTFPETWEEMRALKGIGDYTAAAILSFAFNKKYPVVDGNVHRLLSRYLGIKTPVNTSKAKKEFFEAALDLMESHSPHDFNQAIMEFGSRMCKPANPDCTNCPLNTSCYALTNNKVKQLPVKVKKGKIQDRYFHYLVMREKGKVFLRKRNENDIWENLYEFPLIETEKKISPKKLSLQVETTIGKYFQYNKKYSLAINDNTIKHQLSHQIIHAKFYEVRMMSPFKIKAKGLKAVPQKGVHQYAVPRLIEQYLEQNPEKTKKPLK